MSGSRLLGERNAQPPKGINLLSDGIQAGQCLILDCAPADAVVAKIASGYIYLHWPWRRIDPNSKVSWNGQVSFPVDANHFEWTNAPWRLEPDPEDLSAGDVCLVGIPGLEVVVRTVRQFDPPRDVGWLPRPTVGLSVVPVGDFQDDEEAGFLVYLDGPEPISVSRAS